MLTIYGSQELFAPIHTPITTYPQPPSAYPTYPRSSRTYSSTSPAYYPTSTAYPSSSPVYYPTSPTSPSLSPRYRPACSSYHPACPTSPASNIINYTPFDRGNGGEPTIINGMYNRYESDLQQEKEDINMEYEPDIKLEPLF